MELFFDFDGTLAEGGCYSFEWLYRLARLHGYRGSEAEARAALRWCTDFEVAERLAIPRRSEEFTWSLLEQNRHRLAHAWWHSTLRRVLRELAGRNVLHVLSNRDQMSLEQGLVRIGCRDLFRSCIGTSPGVPGKPATDLYWKLRPDALRSTQAEVYIGDKETDREFSRRVGLGFVAACWYRPTLVEDRASCASLEQLPARLRKIRESGPRELIASRPLR